MVRDALLCTEMSQWRLKDSGDRGRGNLSLFYRHKLGPPLPLQGNKAFNQGLLPMDSTQILTAQALWRQAVGHGTSSTNMEPANASTSQVLAFFPPASVLSPARRCGSVLELLTGFKMKGAY